MKAKDLLKYLFKIQFPLLSCRKYVVEWHVREVGTPKRRLRFHICKTFNYNLNRCNFSQIPIRKFN